MERERGGGGGERREVGDWKGSALSPHQVVWVASVDSCLCNC